MKDALHRELVAMVRAAPDHVILELVRANLGPLSAAATPSQRSKPTISRAVAPAAPVAKAPVSATTFAPPAGPAAERRPAAAKRPAAAERPAAAKSSGSPAIEAPPAAAAPLATPAPRASRVKTAPRAVAAAPGPVDDAAIIEFVRASSGVSSGDVARALRMPQGDVRDVLKTHAKTGTIYRAGERRFTRYARDVKTAEAASRAARGPR